MYAQDNNTLPVWIILSQAHHHISINSQPFLVGIVSRILEQQLPFDKIINAEVMIQNGDEMAMGKVARRSLDADGRMTGTYHDNPFLNTITSDVEFPDGQVKEYGANIIAENMLPQVDSDGYSLSLMDSIIDHQRDPSQAIPKEDKYITTKSGKKMALENHERMETTHQVERQIQGVDQYCRHERGTSG